LHLFNQTRCVFPQLSHFRSAESFGTVGIILDSGLAMVIVYPFPI